MLTEELVLYSSRQIILLCLTSQRKQKHNKISSASSVYWSAWYQELGKAILLTLLVLHWELPLRRTLVQRANFSGSLCLIARSYGWVVRDTTKNV